MEKRGQISMEYLIVVGITTLIAIYLLATSNYYSRQVETTINTNQVDRVAKEIIDTAESMYYFGEPSKTTLKVYLPKGIETIDIISNELTFKVRTEGGLSDIAYSSTVPIQGGIPNTPGFHYIKIEAMSGYVNITSNQ